MDWFWRVRSAEERLRRNVVYVGFVFTFFNVLPATILYLWYLRLGRCSGSKYLEDGGQFWMLVDRVHSVLKAEECEDGGGPPDDVLRADR